MNSSLIPHRYYKASGRRWLGDVPEHWDVKRIRFVADVNPSKNEMSGLSRDIEVSFIPMEAVGEDGSLVLDRVRPIGEVETGYTYFRDGDVTFAKITPCFENGKGAIMRGLVDGIGFGTTELTVARPKHSKTTAEYLYWLFTSAHFRKLGEGAMYGAGGQKRVPDDFLRDFVWAFPPLAEQAAIATFLDHETAKLDALVEEQQRLIELLKEKRQAVISHAITKGLDPNVPMKDSGVEWLGEVPEHWEITRIKHISSHVVDCLHTTPTYDGYVEYPAVRTADLERGRLLLSKCVLCHGMFTKSAFNVWRQLLAIFCIRERASGSAWPPLCRPTLICVWVNE
jgi:type I restriction enzyme S subunit